MAMTNAQFLKQILELNNKYAEEHPLEDELLTPNCKKVIEKTLEEAKAHGNNEAITNLLFNQKLKPNKQ